jgi:predicted nucleic acid-binding protein
MGAWYLDTSAAAKLVVDEVDSSAFRAWASEDDMRLIASDLTRTELLRAARRRDPRLVERVLSVLEAVDAVGVSSRHLRAAAALDPAQLRTLDALHLAVALDLGEGLDGIATYDERLAAAAAAHGLRTAAPGG